MRELALHLMDIAENGVAAGASRIEISVQANTITDRLCLRVGDNGKGMDADTIARVVDPFVTSRTTRKVGLGLPLLKAAAEACDGGLIIHSTPGKGTEVEVEFQLNHIDRMPLGDMTGSMLSLVIGHPEINWVMAYQVDDEQFIFDDRPIKTELDGVALTEPVVISFLRELLAEGVEQVNTKIPVAL